MSPRAPFLRPVALSAVALALVVGCSGGGSASSGSSGSSAAVTSSASSSSAASSSPSSSGSGGVSGESVTQILARAKQQLLGADSLRVAGKFKNDNEIIGLDIGYGPAKTSRGTISSAGTTIELIALGSTVYFKAPDAFWTRRLASNPDAAKVLKGKWIKAPLSNTQFASFRAFTDRATFVNGLFSVTAGLRKGAARTINGVPCVGLTESSATLWVTQAEGRPVVFTGTSAADGKLTFDRYGQVPKPTAPPAASTIDISQVGG